jgi:hypothetical protein
VEIQRELADLAMLDLAVALIALVPDLLREKIIR